MQNNDKNEKRQAHLHACVLRQGNRDNLKRLRKRGDGILLETGARLGVRSQAARKLDFRGTRTGDTTTILFTVNKIFR
jgi:hypothetical protein